MRRLRFLLISPDSDDVFVLTDNHVFIVPYSQRYINISLTILGHGMFSRGQNLSLNFYFNSSDKTDELSHQILNITSLGNAKDKILSQFSSR